MYKTIADFNIFSDIVEEKRTICKYVDHVGLKSLHFQSVSTLYSSFKYDVWCTVCDLCVCVCSTCSCMQAF